MSNLKRQRWLVLVCLLEQRKDFLKYGWKMAEMKKLEQMFLISSDRFFSLIQSMSLFTTKSIRNQLLYTSYYICKWLIFRINQQWRMLKDSNSWNKNKGRKNKWLRVSIEKLEVISLNSEMDKNITRTLITITNSLNSGRREHIWMNILFQVLVLMIIIE